MLEIKNLFVQYQSAKKPSIKDVSFEVERGDHVAILGPSGCGKTTLLNVIAGLLAPKKAEIGGEINWNKGAKKPTIRIVFQEASLLPWRTVEKNIAFGLEIKKISKKEITEKVLEILRIIDLEEYGKYYPHQLSIGMKQRVNFARALVCEPDLLLLDEPFSALDPEIKKNLQLEFLKIMKEADITSIFVTHNVEEAMNMANKIVILSPRPSIVKDVLAQDSALNAEKIIATFQQTL